MEMKTKKSLLVLGTLSALILSASVTHAADALTAELKVVGELTVPTCTVAAVDDGIYDIGKLSSVDIPQSGYKQLPVITKNWVITCDAETYLNFTPVDNRASSMSSSSTTGIYFGMGFVNGTGKIGVFAAKVSNAKVDGVTTSLFTSKSATFTGTAGVDLTLENRTGWTSAANTQKSGKVFTADIAVTPWLGNSTQMNGPITENTDIDGSVTLNFAYGI